MAERRGFVTCMSVIPTEEMIRYLNGERIMIRRVAKGPFNRTEPRTYELRSSFVLHPHVILGSHSYCVGSGSGVGADELLAMYLALKFGDLEYFHRKANPV